MENIKETKVISWEWKCPFCKKQFKSLNIDQLHQWIEQHNLSKKHISEVTEGVGEAKRRIRTEKKIFQL